MTKFLLVFGAGGAGCGLRYLVGLWVGVRTFPYATLLVNVIGSFLMGLVVELVLRNASISPNLRLALTTGFMGGLTTYSTFNYETTALAARGETTTALLNVGATLIGCIVAGLIGIWLARRLT